MSLNKNATDLDLTDLTHTVQFYSCIVIFSIGFVSNSLNILVCIRKELLKNTIGLYNILMSLFNILSLIFVGYLFFFPQSIGQTNLILRSNINCKLIWYFMRVFLQMSVWLNVMITLDRTLCVYSPRTQRLKLVQNKTTMIMAVVCLFLFICGINVANLFYYLDTQAQICTASIFVTMLSNLIPVFMRFLVPLVLQVVLNSILIYKVYKARHILQMPALQKERKFAFTVIILNVILFATEMPILVCTVLIHVFGFNQTYISTTLNFSTFTSFAYE